MISSIDQWGESIVPTSSSDNELNLSNGWTPHNKIYITTPSANISLASLTSGAFVADDRISGAE